MSSTYGDSPVHPIIHQPWRYDIVRFDLHHDPPNGRNDFLDLWLQLGEEVRQLRFLRPRTIKIEEGFPWPTRGMIILDVRHWQWEDVGVQVADFEASRGSVTFYAADVLEVSAAG